MLDGVVLGRPVQSTRGSLRRITRPAPWAAQPSRAPIVQASPTSLISVEALEVQGSLDRGAPLDSGSLVLAATYPPLSFRVACWVLGGSEGAAQPSRLRSAHLLGSFQAPPSSCARRRPLAA